MELALCRHWDGRCRASMLPVASRAAGLYWEDPTAGESWPGMPHFSGGQDPTDCNGDMTPDMRPRAHWPQVQGPQPCPAAAVKQPVAHLLQDRSAGL